VTGSMTLDEMKAVIAGGGSVLYKGQIIAKEGQLPTEAELAKGNPEQEAQAQASLQAQITQLQAQLHQLQGGSQAETTGTQGGADDGGQGTITEQTGTGSRSRKNRSDKDATTEAGDNPPPAGDNPDASQGTGDDKNQDEK
jgi:hypothetical protein